MHEGLGDRRKEVQEGARFIDFVKQLHNTLSLVRRLPQDSLSHEPVAVLLNVKLNGVEAKLLIFRLLYRQKICLRTRPQNL